MCIIFEYDIKLLLIILLCYSYLFVYESHETLRLLLVCYVIANICIIGISIIVTIKVSKEMLGLFSIVHLIATITCQK